MIGGTERAGVSFAGEGLFALEFGHQKSGIARRFVVVVLLFEEACALRLLLTGRSELPAIPSAVAAVFSCLDGLLFQIVEHFVLDVLEFALVVATKVGRVERRVELDDKIV